MTIQKKWLNIFFKWDNVQSIIYSWRPNDFYSSKCYSGCWALWPEIIFRLNLEFYDNIDWLASELFCKYSMFWVWVMQSLLIYFLRNHYQDKKCILCSVPRDGRNVVNCWLLMQTIVHHLLPQTSIGPVQDLNLQVGKIKICT